jgi:MFS family permease
MAFAGFNGLGLALLVPCCQSLIADLYTAEHRGRAFGTLQLTASLGGMLGGECVEPNLSLPSYLSVVMNSRGVSFMFIGAGSTACCRQAVLEVCRHQLYVMC